MALTRKNNNGLFTLQRDRGDESRLQPLTVALVCIVLGSLFMIMATASIHRMKQTLLDVMDDKGRSVIEGIQRISSRKFADLMISGSSGLSSSMELSNLEESFSVKESLAWTLMDLAREIDRRVGTGELSPEGMKKLATAEHLLGVRVYDKKGGVLMQTGPMPANLMVRVRALVEGKKEVMLSLPRSEDVEDAEGLVGLRRESRQGAVLLLFNEAGLRYWGAKVAIQEAAVEIGWRKGVRYLVITDTAGNLIAQMGEYPRAVAKKKNQGHVLEVSGTIKVSDGYSAIARVGLDAEKISGILLENRRAVYLAMGLTIGVSLFAMFLLYRSQNRHLSRIQEMREKLNQAERLSSLGQLGAGVAHEIRNPLNAISMAVQRIQREYVCNIDQAKGDFERLIKVVRDEIGRLNRIKVLPLRSSSHG